MITIIIIIWKHIVSIVLYCSISCTVAFECNIGTVKKTTDFSENNLVMLNIILKNENSNN